MLCRCDNSFMTIQKTTILSLMMIVSPVLPVYAYTTKCCTTIGNRLFGTLLIHRNKRSIGSIPIAWYEASPNSWLDFKRYNLPCKSIARRRLNAVLDDNLHEAVRTPEEITKLPRIYVGQIQIKPVPVSDMTDLAKAITSKTNRLAVPPLEQNSLIELTDDQAHYITTVLRMFKKYDADSSKHTPQIRVFADGIEWIADFLLLDPFELKDNPKRRGPPPDKLVALCRSQLNTSMTKERQHNPPIFCWLCVAPPKNKDRVRWMIEKTTELDCTGYVMLNTDHSESSEEIQGKKFPKLQAYCVEAAEQCERLDLPHFITVIREVQPNKNPTNEELRQELLDVPNTTKLSEFLQVWSEQSNNGVALLICRERSSTIPIWNALEKIYAANKNLDKSSKHNKIKAVAILIGPEGGWSTKEQRLLNVLERDFPDSVYNISLGRNILRTETAALSAMAAFALHRDYVKKETILL